MGLVEYKRKRDFKKTAEPAGAAKARGRKTHANRFIIQKHDVIRSITPISRASFPKANMVVAP